MDSYVLEKVFMYKNNLAQFFAITCAAVIKSSF